MTPPFVREPGSCSCAAHRVLTSDVDGALTRRCLRCNMVWPAMVWPAAIGPGVKRALRNDLDAAWQEIVAAEARRIDDAVAQVRARAGDAWADALVARVPALEADLVAAKNVIAVLEASLADADDRVDDLRADLADEHAHRLAAEVRASSLSDEAGRLRTELAEAHATMGRMVQAAERLERAVRKKR